MAEKITMWGLFFKIEDKQSEAAMVENRIENT